MFLPGIFELLVLVVIILVIIVPAWRIVSKTGYPGVLSLLFLVPVVSIIMLFVLAFSKWPIEKQLEESRRLQS